MWTNKYHFYFRTVTKKCILKIKLYGSESRPVKEEDKTRLQRNYTRNIRWLSNLRPEDKISIEELMTKLKLKSMGQCLQETKMPCFDHLERKKVLGFINVEPSVISQRAIWENME